MCRPNTAPDETHLFISNTSISHQPKTPPPIHDQNPNLLSPLLIPSSKLLDHHHDDHHHLLPIHTNTHLVNDDVDNDENTLTTSIKEAKAISNIALPLILTGLLLYSRSIISMLFLGCLGDLPLAGGSLAIGFANITGYSILSGLAMGMEPICGQAFGAHKHTLLGLTLYRTILLLLLTSIPITLLWLNMEPILLLCGQDRAIAGQAQIYLLYSIPDLLAQSFLHPIRIFLRTQSITFPLTFTAALAIAIHLPLNYLLVVTLGLGLKGVAIAAMCTNFAMLIFLFIYILFSSSCKRGLPSDVSVFSRAGLGGLVGLAIPSCVSVCLEWWWYEIMILLCGLLQNPNATVASMGILIQTTSLIYIFPSSLGVSLSTRVGNELGAGRPKRAKRAAVTGLSISFVLGFSALLFTFMVRGKWASMFTNDVEIIKLTTLVMPIIGLCEIGNCPQTTGCGVLRGTARPKVGANINLGCFYLVGMPVAVWLGFLAGFDFQGLWLGLLAAQGSCMVAMMVVLNATDWEFQAQRAKKLTDPTQLLFEEQENEKHIDIHKHDNQSSLSV